MIDICEEKKIFTDIREIEKLILSKGNRSLVNFNKYSLLFSFTTENIKGYYSKINFQDKKVLSVASSGDHALNAIFCGASSVDIFDINRFCKYYVELKKAGIVGLSYDDFCRSFIEDINFVELYYDCLRQYMADDCRKLWDFVFSKYDGVMLKNNIFRKLITCSDMVHIERLNFYMNYCDYDFLASKLKNTSFRFIESNINTMSSKLDSKYDIILLSNISDYIDIIYGSIDCVQQFKDAITMLSESLNDNGLLVVGYIYNSDYNSDYFCDSMIRNYYFPPKDFKVISFDGVHSNDSKDSIVVYEKTKKLVK